MTVYLNVTEIKKLAAENRLRNKDLAERAGISAQGVSAILRRGTCSVSNAGRLADALDVDVQRIWKEG